MGNYTSKEEDFAGEGSFLTEGKKDGRGKKSTLLGEEIGSWYSKSIES